MTRIQILLPEEQDRRLEKLAAERQQSKASVVREALSLLFRADAAKDEPLLELIGQAGRVGRRDVSRDHDRILGSVERLRNRGS